MIWFLPWEEGNHVKHTHWALYTLLLANIGVFIYLETLDQAAANDLYLHYGLIAGDVHWYQYLTGNFLHAGWLHLIGNMVFLYLFGDNVEDVLGPLGFLLLYLIGGLAGDLLYVSSNPNVLMPSIGASGCIAAVAGAYAVMFPTQPCSVRLMVLVFPVYTFHLRAIWLLLLWFGTDVASTIASRAHMGTDHVNFVAHGVGFFFGAVTALFARMHGVMRRYDALSAGHLLFGYWPSDIEAAQRRALAILAARKGT